MNDSKIILYQTEGCQTRVEKDRNKFVGKLENETKRMEGEGE